VRSSTFALVACALMASRPFSTPRARHTCATLMHLQGVTVAVIAAWIGHKDASLTMRLYAHSQFAALQDPGVSLDRVLTSYDTEPRGHAR
jgi:integrase